MDLGLGRQKMMWKWHVNVVMAAAFMLVGGEMVITGVQSYSAVPHYITIVQCQQLHHTLDQIRNHWPFIRR